MSLVHCCHHSHVPPGATSSPQLRRHFSIFSLLTFKPAPRIVLISKRQPQLQPPALCSHPEAHGCSAQFSSRHLRELADGTYMWGTPSSSTIPVQPRVTWRLWWHRSQGGWWQNAHVPMRKRQSYLAKKENYSEVQGTFWTLMNKSNLQGIKKLFQWTQLLLAQSGLYNLILILYIYILEKFC